MSDIYGKPPEPLNKYVPYGSMKVVCDHQLEQAYTEGWRLVEVLGFQETDQQSEPCHKCAMDAGHMGNQTYRGIVYNRPRFLVGKRYDDELAKVQDETRSELMKRKTAQDKLKDEERRHKEARDERDRYQEYWNTQSEQRDDAVNRAQLMETHIDKAKKHFGEKAWQDAIDEQDDDRRN